MEIEIDENSKYFLEKHADVLDKKELCVVVNDVIYLVIIKILQHQFLLMASKKIDALRLLDNDLFNKELECVPKELFRDKSVKEYLQKVKWIFSVDVKGRHEILSNYLKSALKANELVVKMYKNSKDAEPGKNIKG